MCYLFRQQSCNNVWDFYVCVLCPSSFLNSEWLIYILGTCMYTSNVPVFRTNTLARYHAPRLGFIRDHNTVTLFFEDGLRRKTWSFMNLLQPERWKRYENRRQLTELVRKEGLATIPTLALLNRGKNREERCKYR